MNNFHYIAVLLDMIYGIEMDDEDIEELGLIAWELIGNRNVKLYRCSAVINPKDNSVTLPCNAINGGANGGGSGATGGIIEAVTAGYENWNRVTNRSDYGDIRSLFTEHLIEANKLYNDPLYIPGKLLKYEQVGDKLYFTHNYGKINILYKGILADDEGLPQLTDKEANAIATYLAYITKYKEGLVTNNPNIINLASNLELKWLKLCDQARVTYLNLNDMNNILDAKSSWNRHSYGFSTKPVS